MNINNNNNKETEQIKKNNFSVTEFSNSIKKIKTSIIVFGQKINLWIPKEIWEKWKELAKIEGLSASKLAEKALLEYFKRHPLPNPQLIMDYYIKKPEEMNQPIRVLCVYCDGALSEGKVFCQKRGMWIPSVTCYSCKDNRLRKTK